MHAAPCALHADDAAQLAPRDGEGGSDVAGRLQPRAHCNHKRHTLQVRSACTARMYGRGHGLGTRRVVDQ